MMKNTSIASIILLLLMASAVQVVSADGAAQRTELVSDTGSTPRYTVSLQGRHVLSSPHDILTGVTAAEPATQAVTSLIRKAGAYPTSCQTHFFPAVPVSLRNNPGVSDT